MAKKTKINLSPGNMVGFLYYQSRSGAICVTVPNGAAVTSLTHKQVCDLSLNIYALEDFDYDLYASHYKLRKEMKYIDLAKEFFDETEENGMSNFSVQRRVAIQAFAAWLDRRPTTGEVDRGDSPAPEVGTTSDFSSTTLAESNPAHSN